jgi:hypothetical protein
MSINFNTEQLDFFNVENFVNKIFDDVEHTKESNRLLTLL